MSHDPYAERVNELVCLDMPNGPNLVDRIKRAWDEGDAVFPLDQRLPHSAKKELLDSVGPTIVSTINGDESVDGRRVETGDAVIVATSGTTGKPKAAILTMSAVEASARATSGRLAVTEDDCWLACLPPAHVGGLSVIMRSIILNTEVIAIPAFSVEAYNDSAAKGATLVSLVSTALQRVDPSRYRTIVLGGSRPPADRPDNCISTYGLTETGSGVVYDGRALDGVELDIRESIIHVRAPMLLRAYRDGSNPLDANGWFRTGDRGSLSTDGVLTVEGREGDLIITGGENVWPEQVEATLMTHPGVLDVCVAGVSDNTWGHAVHAWIVTDPEHDITLELMRDHVKQTLAAYCAPQQVHIVGAIPRTALGKPQRHLLASTLD